MTDRHPHPQPLTRQQRRKRQRERDHYQTRGWALTIQPALAEDPERIPAALKLSHDLIHQRAGHARRTGISWSIWGPDDALEHVNATDTTTKAHNMSGTLDEGLDVLDALLADTPAAHIATDYRTQVTLDNYTILVIAEAWLDPAVLGQ